MAGANRLSFQVSHLMLKFKEDRFINKTKTKYHETLNGIPKKLITSLFLPLQL